MSLAGCCWALAENIDMIRKLKRYKRFIFRGLEGIKVQLFISIKEKKINKKCCNDNNTDNQYNDIAKAVFDGNN